MLKYSRLSVFYHSGTKYGEELNCINSPLAPKIAVRRGRAYGVSFVIWLAIGP